MAGLYIREMLARRLLRRVLIAPPAGLVGNWYRELKTLFGLDFRIVVGAGAKSSNPFTGPGSDLIIISVDTLASDRPFARLQEPAVEPYDLCIFDECHKLAADRQPDFSIRKTDRYRVAEALAGVHVGDPAGAGGPPHLLLLTATPHMGKDFPYYALWQLLEPEVLSTVDAFNAYPVDARPSFRPPHQGRRWSASTASASTRVASALPQHSELSQGEISEQTLDKGDQLHRPLLQPSPHPQPLGAPSPCPSFAELASSTCALLRSFERRLEKLDGLIESIKSGKIKPTIWRRCNGISTTSRTFRGRRPATKKTPKNGEEENEIAERKATGGVKPFPIAELIVERDHVQSLLSTPAAPQVDAKGDESKFDKLREALNSNPNHATRSGSYSPSTATPSIHLVQRLEGLGFTGQIARIHGRNGLFRERTRVQIEFFTEHGNEGCLSTWSAPTRPAKASTCSSAWVDCSAGTSPGTPGGSNSGWAAFTSTTSQMHDPVSLHHQRRGRQDPRGASDEDPPGRRSNASARSSTTTKVFDVIMAACLRASAASSNTWRRRSRRKGPPNMFAGSWKGR